MAEIALLTPTAPCHDLVPVRHLMSSSRGFPLLPAAPAPEASLGTTQFILPGPPDLLDVIPPWLIALGMDPVTKRNTRVSNRTISHYAGTQAHGHSQFETDFAPRAWFPNRTGVFRSHPALRSTLITGSCGSGTWRFPSRPLARRPYRSMPSGSFGDSGDW